MIPPYSVRRSWLPGIVSSVTARTTTLLACMAVAVFVATVQGQAKPPMASMVPEGPGWELTGNLLQLMRGIFFPTSNTIFNVQKHDPAEKKITMRPGSGTESFDWVQWGAGLYSGWEDVDYAAVALAEVTPLLLTRGRLCQNGKPVPVGRADWVQYTNDMLKAARKTYEASRQRNQEAVSDSTNDLSDACQGCHRVYRDRRAPGVEPGNPASLALRCMAP
jgi:hypothetical protein